MKIFAVIILCLTFVEGAFAHTVFAPEGKNLKVHWAVLQSKEGKMKEMAEISSRTVAKFTPNEKGSYSLYGAVDKDNPDIMRILEIYEDEEAYQIHRSSEGFQQFIEERKPILESLEILPVDPIVLEQKAEGKGSSAVMILTEVKPENLDEFKALTVQEMTRAVAEDDGVMVMFVTSEQGENSNRIHVFELYRDEEARTKYLTSENFKSYIGKTGKFLTSFKIIENMPVNITLSKKGLHLD